MKVMIMMTKDDDNDDDDDDDDDDNIYITNVGMAPPATSAYYNLYHTRKQLINILLSPRTSHNQTSKNTQNIH